jgi:hypothetical protein
MHPTFPTSRDPLGERCSPIRRRRLRAIFGVAALASILTATTGCDKQAETAEVVHQTSLANKPNIVFLLFGDQGDPRVLPVATTIEGQVAPVSLDAQGGATSTTSTSARNSALALRDGRPTARARSVAGCGTRADRSTSCPAAAR